MQIIFPGFLKNVALFPISNFTSRVRLPSFKWKSSWYVFTFHLFALRVPGKHLREEEEGKNLVSCIVATFRPFPGKERGQETKKHAWVCLEKCCISRSGEEEPDADPLVLHTSADLWVTHCT